MDMNAKLPAWAKLVKENQQEGYIPRIDVDANAMYEAWLDEFSKMKINYGNFAAKTVQIRNVAVPRKKGEDNPTVTITQMTEADKPDPKNPSRYWIECAYQCMKLEMQVALRAFGFELRVHDPEKKWALDKFPPGRGVEAATWGKEAREHFRALRGFLPS